MVPIISGTRTQSRGLRPCKRVPNRSPAVASMEMARFWLTRSLMTGAEGALNTTRIMQGTTSCCMECRKTRSSLSQGRSNA